MTLGELADANRHMGLHEEGIQSAKVVSDFFERIGDVVGQAQYLTNLALLLCKDKQLDAAEEAASRAIDLLQQKDEQFRLCESHRILALVYLFKSEKGKAAHHFEVALGIASPFDWHDQLFQIHHSLAALFLPEGRFDDAQSHIKQAKAHAVNGAYNLGCATEMHALVWYRQRRLEEARSEAFCAADLYEKLGAATDLERCRGFIQKIEGEINKPVVSDKSAYDGELLV